jgi:hypothetical protein
MPREEGTGEELTRATAARVARQRKIAVQEYLAYVRLARRIRLDLGLEIEAINAALSQGQDEYKTIASIAEGMIIGRPHPKVSSTENCTVYIDECGSHTLNAKEKFKAFALGAIIVRESDAEVFDALWKQWKGAYLGGKDKIVHEPGVRRRDGAFYCGGDRARQETAIIQLDDIVSKLPFGAICCVLHRERYLQQWGTEPPNESLPPKTLPNHAYVMMLSFLAERIALALQYHYGGAKGKLVLEARDPLGDALLQYEFSRLFLDGTAYLSSGYFRQQFLPGLSFVTKDRNSSGMQLADLLARPCAEKALDPESDPARWKAFQPKLCTRRLTKHSILGLKVIPWDESCERILPEEEALN